MVLFPSTMDWFGSWALFWTVQGLVSKFRQFHVYLNICSLGFYEVCWVFFFKCCEVFFPRVWQPCLCKTVIVIVEFQLNCIYRGIMFYTETIYIHSCWYKVQFLLNSYIFSCNGCPETRVFVILKQASPKNSYDIMLSIFFGMIL